MICEIHVMAAIEKVCECSSGNCEYHGGDMYGFKRNHLQINLECRGKYFGKSAKVFIVNKKHLDSDYYDAWSNWGGSYGRLYKSDDVYYNGKLYNEGRIKRVNNAFYSHVLVPVRKVFKYEVMVVVDDTQEVFYNEIWDLRKFKLNMSKLFGKGVEYKRIHKKICNKFNYTYDLFECYRDSGLINKGFDNMIAYIDDSIECFGS